jgi:cell wall-associated NlpC family hydrolase
MQKLDARLHAFRDDLADEALQGKVEPRTWAKGQAAQINVPLAGLHKRPDETAMQLTQALYGEACMVFDISNGWAWVQLVNDGYVGYVREQALGDVSTAPRTHRVANVSTRLFPKADLKTQPSSVLYMNSAVGVASLQNGYAVLDNGDAVFAGHLQALGTPESDFVSVAEKFLHVPYYWGGKSCGGIDCSGLVQTALQACGIFALRDSDMQEQSLGTLLHDHSSLMRGDLVFWPGHVGILQSSTQLLHANGHFMMVTSEPLAAVVARSEKAISSVRRLSVNGPIPAAK